VVDEEAAAAHPFERGSCREAVLCAHFLVEDVPDSHGLQAPEHPAGVDVGDVEAALQEDEVTAGVEVREARAPDPWTTGCGVFRDHEACRLAFDHEVQPLVSLPADL